MIAERSKVLVVASTGGHLAQAMRWNERLSLSSDSLFVTFENDQSRSMLADSRHRFVPYVAPRDIRGVAKAFREISHQLRSESFDAVLSTGAGVALAAAGASRLARVPFHYIESVSRFNGPSLSGRVLARTPGVHRYTQHAGYGPRWRLIPSLLSSYRVSSSGAGASNRRDGVRIFVTLGTIKPYRFDRMIEKVLELSTPNDSVVWQTGATDRTDLPGTTHESMSASAFDRELDLADVVVTHAGVGSLLKIIEMGKLPLVAARRADLNEHVDDHQAQALAEFERFGVIRDLMKCDRAQMLCAALERVEFGE